MREIALFPPLVETFQCMFMFLCRFKDEERDTSPDAVDIICDAEREIDSGHDDQNTPYRQSLSFQSKAPDCPESWPGCQVQPPLWAKNGGTGRKMNFQRTE